MRTVLTNDLCRLTEQKYQALPEAGFCAALHLLLGSVSCLNTSKICFFHLPLRSLSCLRENRNHLCWGGTAPSGKQIMYLTLFSQLNWDCLFGTDDNGQGADLAWFGWMTSEMLHLPWFHHVVCSVSRCTDKCTSYIL